MSKMIRAIIALPIVYILIAAADLLINFCLQLNVGANWDILMTFVVIYSVLICLFKTIEYVLFSK